MHTMHVTEEMWAVAERRNDVCCRETSRAAPLLTPSPSPWGQVTTWARNLAPLWSWRAESPAPTGWEWPDGLRPTCPAPPGGTDTGCRDPQKPAKPVWGPWSGATASLAEPRPDRLESRGTGCSPPGWDYALSRHIWKKRGDLNSLKNHFLSAAATWTGLESFTSDAWSTCLSRFPSS